MNVVSHGDPHRMASTMHTLPHHGRRVHHDWLSIYGIASNAAVAASAANGSRGRLDSRGEASTAWSPHWQRLTEKLSTASTCCRRDTVARLPLRRGLHGADVRQIRLGVPLR